MHDFLLEICCEEIPARLQTPALEQLEQLIERHLAPLQAESYKVFITPRRMALCLKQVHGETTRVQKGPLISLGEQALEGFCRKYNIQKSDCFQTSTPKGDVWCGHITQGSIEEQLQEFSRNILREFVWPRRMRWDSQNTWVRPIRHIVCVYNKKPLTWKWGNLTSGAVSEAPPFWSDTATKEEPLFLEDPAQYATILEKHSVVVDIWKRYRIIKKAVEGYAEKNGYELYSLQQQKIQIGPLVNTSDETLKELFFRKYHIGEKEEERGECFQQRIANEDRWCISINPLMEENAGLTQWPTDLLGHFDEEFLQLPPEIIATTLIHHQKCFCLKKKGTQELAPYFIAILDGKFHATETIRDGYERVIRARLSDALFFWNKDKKTPLLQHAQQLDNRLFFQGLGSIRAKTERVEELANELAKEDLDEIAERLESQGGLRPETKEAHDTIKKGVAKVAPVYTADLNTSLVQEMPELQGIIGKHLAHHEGYKPHEAEALSLWRRFYKIVDIQPQHELKDVQPVHQEAIRIAAYLAITDGIDTLVGFFALGKKPSGSKDPYALRRACLNVLVAAVKGNIDLSLYSLTQQSLALYHKQGYLQDISYVDIWPFFKERLVHLLKNRP